MLAPAALRAAALGVAFGGAGADALTSLGQLASGPAIPLSSVDSVSRGASGGADASGLDSGMLATPRAAKPRGGGPPPARPAGRGGGAAGGGPGPRRAGGASSGGSSGSGGGSTGSGGGSAPAPASPGAPSSGRAPSSGPAPSAPKPNPVGNTLDQTQQQLDKLLQPVKPITDGVLGGLGR